MRVLIIGASSFVAGKLVRHLVRDGKIEAAGESSRIDELILADLSEPSAPPGSSPFPVKSIAVDITVPSQAASMVEMRPDVIFHTAAIVSGTASFVSAALA